MIFQRGNKGLSRPCKLVTSIKQLDGVEKTLKRAFKKAGPNALAVAANQVIDNTDGNTPRCFYYKEKLYINPSYIPATNYGGFPHEAYERCLSDNVRNYHLTRYFGIQATFFILDQAHLVQYTRYLTGLEAAVFQHETDHLDGIAIWDKEQSQLSMSHKHSQNAGTGSIDPLSLFS